MGERAGVRQTPVCPGAVRAFNAAQSLAIDPQNPSTVFAGAGEGVFKRTERASSWSAVNSALSGTNAHAWRSTRETRVRYTQRLPPGHSRPPMGERPGVRRSPICRRDTFPNPWRLTLNTPTRYTRGFAGPWDRSRVA